MSILPIVDEFIVALGDCDPNDQTKEEILSIKSDKIRIIDTVWDLEKYPNGMENAHQTDIAKSECKGDWCFYLQADEVVHEKYLDGIASNCAEFRNDPDVEGFLFDYVHFWADYDHIQNSYGWYASEIRIVRNDPEIHSWKSAQSFRRIPDFDGINYRVKDGTEKLKVVEVGASIYHYGWVRPPVLMQNKSKSLDTIHKGKPAADKEYIEKPGYFDYGPLGRLKRFGDTHPEVMKSFISEFNWSEALNYGSKEKNPARKRRKDERLKYRILTWILKLVPWLPIGSRNYRLLRK